MNESLLKLIEKFKDFNGEEASKTLDFPSSFIEERLKAAMKHCDYMAEKLTIIYEARLKLRDHESCEKLRESLQELNEAFSSEEDDKNLAIVCIIYASVRPNCDAVILSLNNPISLTTFQGTKVETICIKKPYGFETDLYNNIFIGSSYFSRLFSIEINDNGIEADVLYEFEKMDPLIGDEVYGLMASSASCGFGPQIRADKLESLLVDAATVGLHVLHGLYVLHEQVKVVHCDVSPNNIMFSVMDDRFKLNDFGESLPIEQASGVPRFNVGTKQYIAPESISTELFTKASDIYSLGRVLSYNFMVQISFLTEMYLDDHNYDKLDHEERVELKAEHKRLVQKVNQLTSLFGKLAVKSPTARPSALESMGLFYQFLIDNQSLVDRIYGQETVLPLVSSLLRASRKEKSLIVTRCVCLL